MPTRAVRRRHCVSGGAPVNFGRRRPVPNYRRAIPEKMSLHLQNLLMTFISHRKSKLQQNKYTVKMASAARRQIIGGGASINKSRRRRPQIVDGGAQLYSKV